MDDREELEVDEMHDLINLDIELFSSEKFDFENDFEESEGEDY